MGVEPGVRSSAGDVTHRRRWWTLATLCSGLLIISIDNTIVNVALPTLSRELGATNSQLQWIIDSYALVFAGLLLPAGALGDRFGRKGTLLVGLVLFLAASAGAASASSVGVLLVGRSVMGLGAALIMPTTLSVITDVFRVPSERAKAIATWAGVAGLGVAIGPVVGGWLLEHFWWGSAFLVNVPILVLAIAATSVFVPRSRDPEEVPLDVGGAVLSLIGLTGLIWSIIEAPTHGWASPRTLVVALLSCSVLGVLLVHERRTRHPMLDLGVFRNARFSASTIAIMLASFALFGSMFLFTQQMQFVLGYTALQTGVRLLPLAAMMMVVAVSSVRLVQRLGTKLVVAGGMATISLGLALTSRLGIDSTYADIIGPLLVLAAGMGATMAPATESIMGAVPVRKAGVGSAVNDTTRELGGALGVAVLGSLLASWFRRPELEAIGARLPEPVVDVASDSIGGALAVAQRIGGPIGTELAAAARTAFVDAMGSAMLVGAAAALVGATIALLFLPARARASRSAGTFDETEDGAVGVADGRDTVATTDVARLVESGRAGRL